MGKVVVARYEYLILTPNLLQSRLPWTEKVVLAYAAHWHRRACAMIGALDLVSAEVGRSPRAVGTALPSLVAKRLLRRRGRTYELTASGQRLTYYDGDALSTCSSLHLPRALLAGWGRDGCLGPAGVLVLAYVHHWDRQGKRAFARQETMAGDLGLSTREVQRGVHILLQLGMVQVKPRNRTSAPTRARTNLCTLKPAGKRALGLTSEASPSPANAASPSPAHVANVAAHEQGRYFVSPKETLKEASSGESVGEPVGFG